MASTPRLFEPTLERALPLSHGADLRFSVFDDSTDPPTPWPPGTVGIVEIDHGDKTVTINAELVDGRLDFRLESELTDSIPATTSSNKVAWRLRIALASDPTTELPVYEGPVYRGRHG